MLIKNPEMVNSILVFLMIVLVLMIVSLLIKNHRKKVEKFNDTPDSKGSKNNQIENFLVYPDQQKFCPNIYNSLSSFWTKLPERYGEGLMAKFCCTSCYYKISKSIFCNENVDGEYKLCTLQMSDISNLENYHRNNNLDFTFPKEKLEQLLGKRVLKMKFDEIHYPIQILKNMDELKIHEDDATIANQLYKAEYDC